LARKKIAGYKSQDKMSNLPVFSIYQGILPSLYIDSRICAFLLYFFYSLLIANLMVFYYFWKRKNDMHFSFLDIIIAIPFAWAIYMGLTKGFVRQLATLGALILGVYGGAKLSGWLGEFFHRKFDVAIKLSQFVSFVIIFIAVIILMHFLAKIIQSSLKAGGLGAIDKILGVLFAMVKALIIVGVILSFFEMINKKVVLVEKQYTERSFFYNPIVNLTGKVFPTIKFEYNNQINK